MVFVNSKKFACESCIKGHRSSACHHTDRPLFEIKKKGRPVSQCTKCRELRQSKKFHSKCTCNDGAEEAPAMQPLASSSGSKTKRFIPIVPSLPNGLRDVLGRSQSSRSFPVDSRQRVDSLLNPCDCKTLWDCQCDKATGSSVPVYATKSTNALSTLAQVAATKRNCCSRPPPTDPGPSSHQNTSTSRKEIPWPRSPTGPPYHPSNERHKKRTSYPALAPGPDLAPILYMSSPSSPLSSASIPEFPSMPPMSEFTSFAGSGCTCGVKCACPGCSEHQSISSNHERRDCADGCRTCIDPSLAMALPSLGNAQSGTSILDRFFATAAALPAPPTHRRTSSYHLDSMNTTVHSSSTGQQTFAFGSVNLPRLECCGDQCGCPSGQCTCRVPFVQCCTTSVRPLVDLSTAETTT